MLIVSMLSCVTITSMNANEPCLGCGICTSGDAYAMPRHCRDSAERRAAWTRYECASRYLTGTIFDSMTVCRMYDPVRYQQLSDELAKPGSENQIVQCIDNITAMFIEVQQRNPHLLKIYNDYYSGVYRYFTFESDFRAYVKNLIVN